MSKQKTRLAQEIGAQARIKTLYFATRENTSLLLVEIFSNNRVNQNGTFPERSFERRKIGETKETEEPPSKIVPALKKTKLGIIQQRLCFT